MNKGPNKGRRLRLALTRFAAVLIEEARDVTGLSYERLDEALGLAPGQAIRYSRYNKGGGATRAPQAAGIQDLENRVAALLGRIAHTVVVENNARMGEGGFALDGFIADMPLENLNLRDYSSEDFQLGYEADWPTYRRLKYDPNEIGRGSLPIHELVKLGAEGEWPQLLQLYSWQWGVLWDCGLSWLSRSSLGVDEGVPVESFLPCVTRSYRAERALLAEYAETIDGRSYLEQLEVNRHGFPRHSRAVGNTAFHTRPATYHC